MAFENLSPLNLSLADAYVVLKEPVIFVIGILIYSIFVFKFYRFLAKKDIFQLNLKQFNRVPHAGLKKSLDVLLYIIEYLIIFPIFTIFWFGVFSLLFFYLSENQSINTILIIAMSLVAVIRFTAYYTEDLSRDLSKMIPLALLAVFLIDISLFQHQSVAEIITALKINFKNIVYYLIFIVLLEFVLRIIDEIYLIFKKDPTLVTPPVKRRKRS